MVGTWMKKAEVRLTQLISSHIQVVWFGIDYLGSVHNGMTEYRYSLIFGDVSATSRRC